MNGNMGVNDADQSLLSKNIFKITNYGLKTIPRERMAKEIMVRKRSLISQLNEKLLLVEQPLKRLIPI
jgi:hypothetical protein